MIDLLKWGLRIFLHQPPVRGSVDPRGWRRVTPPLSAAGARTLSWWLRREQFSLTSAQRATAWPVESGIWDCFAVCFPCPASSEETPPREPKFVEADTRCSCVCCMCCWRRPTCCCCRGPPPSHCPSAAPPPSGSQRSLQGAVRPPARPALIWRSSAGQGRRTRFLRAALAPGTLWKWVWCTLSSTLRRDSSPESPTKVSEITVVLSLYMCISDVDEESEEI